MFTVDDRNRILSELLDAARQGAGVVGAALVGSAARGREDAWSDIDLALQLSPEADETAIVDEWSRWIDQQFAVADSFDVFAAGNVRYRVFLLNSSLQIDVSFWPHEQFRATEDGFHLVFGNPAAPTSPPEPDVASLIGFGWLYALHARSAIARGRLWQAVMMLDELRDQLVALACIRHGLNPWHGRDVDRLPSDVHAMLAQSRATEVTPAALGRSHRHLISLFVDEIAHHDPARAAALRGALQTIAETASSERG